MNNYKKGKNSEEPFLKENILIPNLPSDFLWMQVRGGSKIRNLLSAAMEQFPEKKWVVWTGCGTSVGKTITCAEIMKRKMNNSLYQITKICFRLIEEFWDPIIPELDQIVVKRRLPMIHILLSTEVLNSEELGYQAPNISLHYLPQKRRQSRNKGYNRNTDKESRHFKSNGSVNNDKNSKSVNNNR